MKTFFINRFIVFFFIFWFNIFIVSGQPADSITEKFTVVKSIACTSVKNQNKSKTCWSFAVISMLESELIKEGKGEFNLSEMYIVHQAYLEKAERFLRMHGSINFSGGGALNDPIDIIKKYGIVPANVYTGLKDGSKNINHLEMDAALKDSVIGLIKNKKLSASWKERFSNILDIYLGKIPEIFVYQDKEYTPQSFTKMLDIDPDNYILITSFIHHPYYQKFILEVPDNWSWGESYNLPLNEFQEIIDYSLEKGYTVAIACDMTEKGFLRKKGIALALNFNNTGNDPVNCCGAGVSIGDTSKHKLNEVAVTPQIRQEAFDDYETTDDHDFHIVGIAKDQSGKKFYIAKNSWGTEATKYGGYIYLSENYLLYKSLNVLINKKALPSDIQKKIGI
jgi:bleomycin hydrolase